MFIENYTALGYLLSQRNITRSPTSTFQKYLACDKKHCLPTTHDTVVCMVRVNALLVMGKSGDKAIHQDRPSRLSELTHGRKCMLPHSKQARQRPGGGDASLRGNTCRLPPRGRQDGKLTSLSMQPAHVPHDGSGEVWSPTGRK